MDRHIEISDVLVFRVLTDHEKQANGIKLNPASPRFDIDGVYPDDSSFITPLLNRKNQCNISLIEARTIVSSDDKRRVDLLLKSNQVGNITSLYYSQPGSKRFYGYTNPNKEINRGKQPNPMYKFREDLLLIELSEDMKQIIIAVIPQGRHFATHIYPDFCNGKYDGLIQEKLDFLYAEFNYVL